MRPELFRGIEAGTRDFCDMQIISSGPDKTTQQIHDNYLRLINKAQKSIYIQTPYFIPDEAILNALMIAVKSGIEVEIPKEIAGLLLSAIISDTLMFRSPTCTPFDKGVAKRLAEIADVDIEDHAKKMFRAGSDFKNKTTEEIFYQDFKIFHTEDCDFGVAQISAMSGEELEQIGEQLRPFLPQVLGEKRLNMVYVMLTDILEESSKIIFAGEDAGKILAHAFKKQEDADGILLDGIISRKKQMIPTLMNEMSERA